MTGIGRLQSLAAAAAKAKAAPVAKKTNVGKKM